MCVAAKDCTRRLPDEILLVVFRHPTPGGLILVATRAADRP
jgi:hypothetical protein